MMTSPSLRRLFTHPRAWMLAALVPLSSCNGWPSVGTASARSEPAVTPAAELDLDSGPYPRGKWRELSQSALESRMLWASHILIRHNQIRLQSVSFAPPDWRTSSPLPNRSREQALALARQLVGELRKVPDQFAAFAQKHSEDAPTRDNGGSLGGQSAYAFSLWPPLLDALAALEPGQVSEPIETEYGVHIIIEQPPPPEETVTGSHIVIGYDDARWLHNVLARGPVPWRTRDEALALATRIYETARQHPEKFPELVQQHSEHTDAARGGDVGSWSTHEVTSFPREVETLRRLAVGQVSPPIDSLVGFQIILRTPNRPRRDYAMSAIALLFDAKAPDDRDNSRRTVMARARTVADTLARDPSQFDFMQQTHCCRDVIVWREGSEYPGVDVALEPLAFGEIAKQPVETIGQIFVPKRLDPKLHPRPRAELGLP